MKWWDCPSLPRSVALGVLGGGIALININPVPIFVVALIAPVLLKGDDRAAALRCSVVSAAVAFLLVSPWLIRNAVVFGEFVPLRSNTGFQLMEGNNPLGSIRETTESLHPALQKEELALYEKLGEMNYMRQAFSKALRYMWRHPYETTNRILERVYVTWCTDIFDWWSWVPGRKWWHSGKYWMIRTVVTIVSALVPLVTVIVGLILGRLRELPYRFLFISIFFFMPLPHYLTQVDDPYTEVLRIWLTMLNILILNIDKTLGRLGQTNNLSLRFRPKVRT